MKELSDQQINLEKIKKIKNDLEYIEIEIEYGLFPNILVLEEMMDLIIDIKRSVK